VSVFKWKAVQPLCGNHQCSLFEEAWNLAFALVWDELNAHHVAMPWQITTCLIRGWLDVAGMFALTWGALLRVGEFSECYKERPFAAIRYEFSNSFVLLSVQELRTRFIAARHQCANWIFPPWWELCIGFSQLQPLQKLWPRSGQTLRLRFRQVLALGWSWNLLPSTVKVWT